MIYDPKLLHARIKYVATLQNVTLKEIVVKTGIGINGIQGMRAGNMPSVATVAHIADVLGVSVDYLLGRTDKPDINR